MPLHPIAIDIGASSGRVIVGTFENDQLSLHEQHRFSNKLVQKNNQLCWDIDYLYQEIIVGIEKTIANGFQPSSIGIDTWGVDFVLVDQQGHRVGEAVSYRDNRTSGVMQQSFSDLKSKLDLYQLTGIQFLPFNTLYQLKTLKPESLTHVRHLLLIPDYFNFLLTGAFHCDYSNASTTQMLNCETKQWSDEIIDRLGLPKAWFLPPKMPNQIIGQFQTCGFNIPVAAIASHDTASAVVGTPLNSKRAAYISSGTWSLMGYESVSPVINPYSLEANITNEGGAEGRYRILKNIMGMWLIQNLQKKNPAYSCADLAGMAEQEPAFIFLINPDDDAFLNPNDMQTAIIHYCQKTGQGTPGSLAQIARCIYDSLALRYLEVFRELNAVSSHDLTEIHVVGGGANNSFLNQLCADVCNVPVRTNPVEASALGNMVGQLIAINAIDSVQHGRDIIALSFQINKFTPNPIQNIDAVIQRFEQLTK